MVHRSFLRRFLVIVIVALALNFLAAQLLGRSLSTQEVTTIDFAVMTCVGIIMRKQLREALAAAAVGDKQRQFIESKEFWPLIGCFWIVAYLLTILMSPILMPLFI